MFHNTHFNPYLFCHWTHSVCHMMNKCYVILFKIQNQHTLIRGNASFISKCVKHNGVRVKGIFSCGQTALLTVLYVRRSVCSSVRPTVTPFSQCLCSCIIIKFSGVITIDKSYVHATGQGERSSVNVTEIKANFAPIWGISEWQLIWMHWWLWSDAQSFKRHRSDLLSVRSCVLTSVSQTNARGSHADAQ